VILGVDYEKAISPVAQENPNDYFFAVARNRLSANGIKFSKNQIHSIIQSLRSEMKIHQIVNGKPGVSKIESFIIESDPKKSENTNLFIIQKLYDEDLFDLVVTLQGMGLGERVKHFRGRSFERVRASLAVQLLGGLSQIHAAQIHHRDIKPENIFVDFDSKGLPKTHIADFGLSVNLDWLKSGEQVSNFGGTYAYMAPQFLRDCLNGNFNKANENIKNDVWSMGLTLYLLDRHHKPLKLSEYSDEETVLAVSNVRRYIDLNTQLGIPEFSKSLPRPETFEYVVFQMLNPDPNLRWTAAEAYLAMKQVLEKENSKFDPEFYFELN
jgi:serine/threonine protein kinase